jgi:peptidoglycan/xylan/chitin deacetylase (PgdA/CDA1 family)
MVGSSVPNYKSTVKRMAKLGCELGNHSYDHSRMSALSDSARASQVSRTSSNIKSAAGAAPTVFRLPYGDGASNAGVLSSLGLPSIYWSLDTRDWANTSDPQHTVQAVLGSVKNGDIILMHDIHKSSVDAAETIIPALINRGYQLVTVTQLAQYKGKTTLHSGKTYYSF